MKIGRHYEVTARINRTHEFKCGTPNHQSDYHSTCIKDEYSRAGSYPFLGGQGAHPTPKRGQGELMAAALGFISKLESG